MMKNKNLFNGNFKRKELEVYSLDERKIDVILEYQELVPILQDEDNKSEVSLKILYGQLGLAKSQYSRWVKKNILEDEFAIENEDFKRVRLNVEGNETYDYLLTLEYAKEIAMMSKGRVGKVVRRYFIYIEEAFTIRNAWNENRISSIIKCKSLVKAIKENEGKFINQPTWSINDYQSEFCLLNDIIVGMSATEYRKINKLKKSEPVRNNFTHNQLKLVEELERYDADLILIQKILDRNKRKEYLGMKLNYIRQDIAS